jgi:hypothetical protein
MATFAREYSIDGTCRIVDVTAVPGTSAAGSVQISASVGANAANRRADVRTIQDALNQVPEQDGGPNPPLKTDGLCYGKTQAAIKRFQSIACGFKWPDGLVEPGRKTHLKLQEYYVAPSPYSVLYVYTRLPAAVAWVYAARAACRDAEFALRGLPAAPRGLTLLNKYFHADKLLKQQALSLVAKINSLFLTMETCIGRSTPMTSPGTGYFQEDPHNNRAYAYTWSGGYTMPGPKAGGPPVSSELPVPGVRKDAIYVCPQKLNVQPPDFYTMAIVHELAHFCGPLEGTSDAIVDHSYRNRPNFFQLSPWEAERTADCYAHFAGEAALGREAPHS